MRSTVVLAFVAACSTPPSHRALPFLDNAFEIARAEANARHVPMFVEVWAPW
jgi:hypothetical protein